MNQAYPRRTASGLYFETKEDWEKYIDDKLKVSRFKVIDFKKENNAWIGAQRRCEDKAHKSYPYFGGRGISFSPEWKGKEGFIRFLKHIGPAPSPRHQLDRIISWRHYEFGNVRWLTPMEQVENQARHYVEYQVNGRYRNLSGWAREAGMLVQTLHKRVRVSGMPIERALSIPVRRIQWAASA